MRKVLYLLGQLTDADIDWLITAGRRERSATGAVLIREGQPTDALYVLLDGTLEVSGRAVGRGQPIALQVGEVVGEISFVDSRPPVATVTAATDAVLLAIPREKLQAKLADDAPFAARFYRAIALFLAQRLRGLGLRLGYGQAEPHADQEQEDELGGELLDNVHLAGARFDRVLQRLMRD
jgi:CRP-like cAMP-binding protein